MQARSAYRWDDEKIDPDVVRQNEEKLERLLRMARARNAAAHSLERPSFEEWPIAGSDFVWHLPLAGGTKAPRDRRTTTLPKSEMTPRGTSLTRSVMWMLLLLAAGLASVPFGADVVRIAAAVL